MMRPGLDTNTKSERLSLRLSGDDKRVLQQAALATESSLSEFVRESALAKAADMLPDRHRFSLSAEAWAAFQKSLDAPAFAKPRLSKLLRNKGVFENDVRK